jgi:hypothetical protein
MNPHSGPRDRAGVLQERNLAHPGRCLRPAPGPVIRGFLALVVFGWTTSATAGEQVPTGDAPGSASDADKVPDLATGPGSATTPGSATSPGSKTIPDSETSPGSETIPDSETSPGGPDPTAATPAETPSSDLAVSPTAAPAAPPRPLQADLSGHFKQYFLATFPLESPLLPEEPWGQSIVDFRLKGALKLGNWRAEFHPVLTGLAPGSAATAGAFVQTGQGVAQAVDLNAELVDSSGLYLQLRLDRAMVAGRQGPLGFTLGRQPISFGRGTFFTPLDLVNPFLPTTLDSSYKPGVDAVRLDGYLGEATSLTLAAAYAGDWDLQGSVLAAYAQTTLGTWDLGLLVAAAHADLVGGLSANGSLGPVGLRLEGSLTRPDPEGEAPLLDPLLATFDQPTAGALRDPYVRALLGADWKPWEKTFLSGELYLQTLGESDPQLYLPRSSDPHYLRGELWLAGRTYAAIAVQQELRPTLNSGLSLIANLGDPSALAGLNVSWSIADNADLVFGGYAGLGARPGQPDRLDPTTAASLRLAEAAGLLSPREVAQARSAYRFAHTPISSEFGNTPLITFAQLRSFF